MPNFFAIEKHIKGRLGRAGVIETTHGKAETPAFVIVGTRASVKAMTPVQVKNLGGQIVLSNTYHLYLQPGDELVRDAGGIHKFMRWDGVMMTDSGGFQVYSLGSAYGRDCGKFLSKHDVEKFLRDPLLEDSKKRLSTIDEEGAVFKSHIDGSVHRITPEKSIEIQHNLGADIIFAFDECTSPTDSYEYQRESMERTHRWAERSLRKHQELQAVNREPNAALQALFGIVQGGPYMDLREISARTIAKMDFDGFGIGGSYTKEEMQNVLRWVCPILSEEKPRHLLGIGEPLQLFIGIENGVDTFDCVAPAREARNGRFYTTGGTFNITNARFSRDFRVIDEGCECDTCTQGFSRAYISYLFRARELLAFTLATVHNLYFFVRLVRNIHQSILEERFFEYKEEFMERYRGSF